MADRVTGFGETIDEFEERNGDLVPLERLVEAERETYGGADKIEASMGDVRATGDGVVVEGELVAGWDDGAADVMSKLLGIPGAYMRRLDVGMQCVNANWWLERLGEKDVTLVVKDGALVDACAGQRIERLDVMEAIGRQCPGFDVLDVVHQANSTTIDIIDRSCAKPTERETWCMGVRVVHKSGLNAPDMSPMMMSLDSCSVVEFASPDAINIKGLSYPDVLRVIEDRVGFCASTCVDHFKRYLSIAGCDVRNPRRRISLISREHGLPERVKAYALAAFDDSGLQGATYEDIVDLFASLPHKDEVKGASARRLQRIAGFVATKGASERRCTVCDSVLVDV